MLFLEKVSSRYGAPMGRRNSYPADVESVSRIRRRRVSLHRIPLNAGGYDSGGAYWGHGLPLYGASSPCGEFVMFIRAASREAAKVEVIAEFQEARFYR